MTVCLEGIIEYQQGHGLSAFFPRVVFYTCFDLVLYHLHLQSAFVNVAPCASSHVLAQGT